MCCCTETAGCLSLTEQNNGNDQSEQHIALNQEETELVLEIMTHHGQSRSVQLLGCALLRSFCHLATVDSSQGAQVMMNAASHFPQDEEVQEVFWYDLILRVEERHLAVLTPLQMEEISRQNLAFVSHLTAHNALPLGYAAMDHHTQNYKIC